MSLKDYRTSPSDLPQEEADTPAPSSLYVNERDALKIDKLSNRVTIISVILPVLIGVVLFFIYLDIKDQVSDADMSKKTQVEDVARQAEEKLNALDMRIAKNRFDLDEKLPLLEKKGQSLETQLAKMAASKADTAALDAGVKRLESILDKHDHRIQNNAVQDQANLAELERINAALLSVIAQNRDQIGKETQALKQDAERLQKEITALKETVNTKIGDLQRLQRDLSLLDKLVKDMENQFVTRKELNQRLTGLETGFNQTLEALEKQQTPPASLNTAPDQQAQPKIIVPEDISEGTLKQ
jgi:chromosome segregation ATPase